MITKKSHLNSFLYKISIKFSIKLNMFVEFTKAAAILWDEVIRYDYV